MYLGVQGEKIDLGVFRTCSCPNPTPTPEGASSSSCKEEPKEAKDSELGVSEDPYQHVFPESWAVEDDEGNTFL